MDTLFCRVIILLAELKKETASSYPMSCYSIGLSSKSVKFVIPILFSFFYLLFSSYATDIKKHMTPHTIATMIVIEPIKACGYSLNLNAFVTIVTFVVTF